MQARSNFPGKAICLKGMGKEGDSMRLLVAEDDRALGQFLSRGLEADGHRVRLARDGETVFPVDMKMTLASGEVVRQQWDGRERWVRYEYTKTSPVKSVEIDPGGRILLDGSFADNSYVAEPAVAPFAKWSSNLLFWIQMVLP